MKKRFTLYQLLVLFPLLLFLLPNHAKAQAVAVGVCEYEADCFFIAYESVLETSPGSDELLVVLAAFFFEEPRCNNIDGLLLTASDGSVAIVDRADLAADPFIELTVNRDVFTETPDVLVSTFRYLSIPVLGIRIPIPTDVVDLQARLDSDNPCVPITPLPVELVSFTGAATTTGINLKWRTASEQDNKQFEVERSADGKSFEQIGIVAGHGNSSVLLDYSFDDIDPLSGTNYYRLKQVDFSGSYEYSHVIAAEVVFQGDERIVVAPNPCRGGDCAILFGRNGIKSETRIELTDMAGRVVYSRTLSAGDDPNIRFNELGNLRGLYLLKVSAGGAPGTVQRVAFE